MALILKVTEKDEVNNSSVPFGYRSISCVLSSCGMLLRAGSKAMVEVLFMTTPEVKET
jgi:hypothetical protein